MLSEEEDVRDFGGQDLTDYISLNPEFVKLIKKYEMTMPKDEAIQMATIEWIGTFEQRHKKDD